MTRMARTVARMARWLADLADPTKIRKFEILSWSILKLAYKFRTFVGLLTQAEFQCVYTKQNLNETVKPNLNKNFSVPWTPHGEKESETHQIRLPKGKATSFNFPQVS